MKKFEGIVKNNRKINFYGIWWKDYNDYVVFRNRELMEKKKHEHLYRKIVKSMCFKVIKGGK